MSKVDDNKRKKYDQLMQAAYALFLKQGFQNTSISDIVKKAGVAKGTFYLYFQDKYEIRNQLITYKSGEMINEAICEMERSDAAKDSFEERLINTIDRILGKLEENPAKMSFLYKNLSWGLFRETMQGEMPEEYGFSSINEHVISQAQGRIRDSEVMMFLIFELVGATAYSAIIHREPVPLGVIKPNLYQAIRNIVKSHMQ